jgi:hypothetical protein
MTSLVGWCHRGLVRPLSAIDEVAWGDFGTFYMAGYSALHGHDLYDLKHTRALARTLGMRRGPPEFCYPPHIALLFMPVAAVLTPAEAAVVSVVSNAILYWAAVFLLFWGLSFPRSATALGVAVIAAASYAPSWETIGTGQVNIVVLLFVVVGLVAYERERWARSGASLGVAAVVKLFPGATAIQLLADRKTRALGVMIGVGLAVLCVSVAVLGPGPFERYLRNELPKNAGLVHAGANDVSLNSFVSRVSGAGTSPGDSSVAAQHASNVSRLLRIAVFLVSGLLAVVPSRNSTALPFDRMCLLLIAAMIVNAWTWTEHLVVALPAIAVVTRRMPALPRPAYRCVVAGVALSYGLMALSFHVPVYKHGSMLVRELVRSSSLNLYGLGLLWMTLALRILIRQRGATSSSPDSPCGFGQKQPK